MRISDWSSDVCSSDLAAEARPVPEDIANIVLRLADPGNQASPHPAWSGIVGREREMILPECVQLLAQIARAAPQIALDAVPIDAETRGRRRQDRKSTRLNSSH